MSLIAIWLVSIENRTVLFRRYFPNNGIKSSDGKMLAMLTMQEEGQFVSGLMGSLGLDTNNTFNNSSNTELEYSFSFDCTQVNQLPALGFHLNGYRIWPIIVLEHKGILFCGLPALNNPSTNLIDHIGVSLTVSTLQTLINYFSTDSRLYLLEEYFTKNMPFGCQITNPYEIEDEVFIKSKSESKLMSASTTSLSSTSSSSKQELVLTIRVTEFISSADPGHEMIHGTVYICNNIVLPGNPLLTYRIDNLHNLNPILSPHCWLNNTGFSSSSSSASSSPASSVPSSSSSICLKLNSKALRYFHYKCNPDLVPEQFLQYTYNVSRKTGSNINHLDLAITIKEASSMRFHSFRVNFNGVPLGLISKLSNCIASHGQLHMDKQNGFYWMIGTKVPKNGKLRLTADLNCSKLSTDQLDGSAHFRVDNYAHGFPRPRTDSFTVNDNLYSINFKLTPQLTMATFEYRIKATFS